MARKRVLWLCGGALLLSFGLALGFVKLDNYLDPFDDLPFSPQAWANAESQARGPMARDAMRWIPIGMPADRVQELLGKTDKYFPGVGGDRDGFGNRLRGHTTWSYYLGSSSSMSRYGLDSAFLYVHFDADELVVAVEITGG